MSSQASILDMKNCYKAGDYGSSKKEALIVRPLGTKCHVICQAQCQEFSQIYKDATGNIELNQDIIDACLLQCQRGSIYTSKYRVAKKDSLWGWVWSGNMRKISTLATCSTQEDNEESPDFAYFSTEMAVRKGDIVSVSLSNSQASFNNTIFLCGFDTKKITPEKFYLNKDKDVKSYPYMSTSNAESSWDAQKTGLYDTKIPIKKGDYLKVMYSGKFFGDYNNHSKNDLDLKTSLDDTNIPGSELGLCYFIKKEKGVSSFCIDKDNNTIQCSNADFSSKQSEGLNTKDCDTIRKNLSSSTPKFYDLYATRSYVIKNVVNNRSLLSNYQMDRFVFEGFLDKNIQETNSLRIGYNDPKKISYKCTGNYYFPNKDYIICKGPELLRPRWCYDKKVDTMTCKYSDGRSSVTKPYDADNMSGSFFQDGDYSNNYGGYEVEISRKGCPYKDGGGLQYAIVPLIKDNMGSPVYKPEDSSVSWSDVGDIKNGGFQLKIDNDGKPFFRINPNLIQQSSDKKPMRENTMGEYSILIDKQEKINTGMGGIISDIINEIRTFFIGDNKDSGTVHNIFNLVIKNPVIVHSIRVLLVLYIGYLGLGYMVGFIRITQKDAVIEVLKITLVVVLISPNSWNFFSTYLFGVMLDAGMELTYYLVQPLGFRKAENISGKGISEITQFVFENYDQMFYELFNNVVWTKIWSLICTSLIGVILGFLAIIAIKDYMICVIRAITMYIISIITLCILFILAPIFISFSLFKKTNDLFKSWINNMISMALQPLFVFFAIAFLHKMFIATFHMALGFAACPTCLLKLDLFGWQACVPGEGIWWVALQGAHYPLIGGINALESIFVSTIALAICAHAMKRMTDFASKMASKIATNSFYGFDLDAPAASMNAEFMKSTSPIRQTAGLGARVALGITSTIESKVYEKAGQGANKVRRAITNYFNRK